MHHELPILINIAVALCVAFIGGVIARRLKMPTMVGYLVGGVIISPFTPGFVGDLETIRQLAELGVIFLLFGVGLHFSLRDLWAVRDVAIPGAIIQMLVITGLGMALASWWGWNIGAGIVLGLAAAIASTIVLIKTLMDRGLLNTSIGQAAVGWLIMEDLLTVLILVLLPAFVEKSGGQVWLTAGISLVKAIAFAALMLVIGKRVIPWFLERMALLRSRELFIVAVVALTVGISLGAAYLFGVSLALGAFLAGVVVSESKLSYQVGAEMQPFQETFSVLFFVSVGMLVDPFTLLPHIFEIAGIVLLIVVGKFVSTLVLGFFLSRSAETTLTLAAGRSQIGEFSFILGETGVALALLSHEQYSLLLASAIISITLNPLLFRSLPAIEKGLRKVPAIWNLLDRHTPRPAYQESNLQDHVVVVGYGRVGQHIVRILKYLGAEYVVVDWDAQRVLELEKMGIRTLYGDAANSEILDNVYLKKAKAVVVTLPDETAATIVVAAVRELSDSVPIVVRAATRDGVQRLFSIGAQAVIHPELEGGLEVVRQTLTRLGYGDEEIQEYIDTVRDGHYESTPADQEALQHILESARIVDSGKGVVS